MADEIKAKEIQPDEGENELTEKQKRFCERYVFDWNGTKAYQYVYPNAGYATARVGASRLLTKDNIRAHIEALKTRTAELAGVSSLRVATEFTKLAFADTAKLREDWYTVKDWDKLTDDEKAILSEIEVTEKVLRGGEDDIQVLERKLKYKVHDKQKALTELKKMFGYDSPVKIDTTIQAKYEDLTDDQIQERLKNIGTEK
jgi:phage terminase small subunit